MAGGIGIYGGGKSVEFERVLLEEMDDAGMSENLFLQGSIG